MSAPRLDLRVARRGSLDVRASSGRSCEAPITLPARCSRAVVSRKRSSSRCCAGSARGAEPRRSGSGGSSSSRGWRGCVGRQAQSSPPGRRSLALSSARTLRASRCSSASFRRVWVRATAFGAPRSTLGVNRPVEELRGAVLPGRAIGDRPCRTTCVRHAWSRLRRAVAEHVAVRDCGRFASAVHASGPGPELPRSRLRRMPARNHTWSIASDVNHS